MILGEFLVTVIISFLLFYWFFDEFTVNNSKLIKNPIKQLKTSPKSNKTIKNIINTVNNQKLIKNPIKLSKIV